MKATYQQGRHTYTAEVWRVRGIGACGNILVSDNSGLVVRTEGEGIAHMTGCSMRQVRAFCAEFDWTVEPVKEPFRGSRRLDAPVARLGR